MVRTALATFAAASLLAVAACGGTERTSGSAADEIAGLVPADAALVLALETDPESEQWQRAEQLLDKFPGRKQLYDAFTKELAEEDLDFRRDVVPAFGERTYVVFLDFAKDGENVVALTKPRDRAKLDALLATSDEQPVTREVEGWTLVAKSDAILDRFSQAGDKLEDADWFEDAQGRVEDGALLTVLGNGPAVLAASRSALPEGCEVPEAAGKLRFFAGAVTAEEDGVRMTGAAVSEGAEEVELGESLIDRVPAEAFAYLGGRGLPLGQLGFADQLRCAGGANLESTERMLGVSFDDIFDLFAGGFAFYARPAPGIPELTLLLAPKDEAKALRTLDTLAGKLAPLTGGAVQPRPVDGIQAKELRAGPVTVLYGADDGRIAVSTTRGGFDALRGEGDSLTGSDSFEKALDAAGVDDAEDVAAYVDLRAIVDLVRTLGGFAGGIPADVQANLEPLRSFVAWGDMEDPNDAEFGFFLGIG